MNQQQVKPNEKKLQRGDKICKASQRDHFTYGYMSKIHRPLDRKRTICNEGLRPIGIRPITATYARILNGNIKMLCKTCFPEYFTNKP